MNMINQKNKFLPVKDLCLYYLILEQNELVIKLVDKLKMVYTLEELKHRAKSLQLVFQSP